MSTYGDIKARIADELDRSDLATQISEEIVRAVNYYERERWWFGETVATITTSASQADYSITTYLPGLIHLDDIEVFSSSRWMPVNPISWQRYIHDWGQVLTGNVPEDYAVYQDAVWLGPFPNTAYLLAVSYAAALTTLSADGDVNAWTTYGEDLIASRALHRIGKRIMHMPDGELVDYKIQEREAYVALCTINAQRVMTGEARYQE